ncbi:helix-turn-helix transcriptional regulator [Paenibacillus sp. JDR-2]|uniref:helix-turn-helix transcriptional regulator n=1 Tax=Paenibacillus sp. (strain JDR-2) TaxID=324057 RepID=UPI0001664949|nr:helix-turn-helix transcriptional regulator [Paenibacillus sp. JDR-2]ACT03792.1 transcriptional regulator, XRE family [Paenibacillus sp. JDR-2]
MSISANLKKLRDKYDLTQQDLADIAGVTNKAVSAWETGLKEPRMGAIEKIANRFGLKKSNLIEENGMDLKFLPKQEETNGEDWTEEELNEINAFKRFILSKRQHK